MTGHDPHSGTIGTRLAAVAGRFAQRTAIVEGETHVTYATLDAAATAIARRLLDVAAAHSGCVCLFFENKIPALKALFGAARYGRAYVLLDAGDPEERLRFILGDSEPVALLTEAALLGRALAIAPDGCAVVDIGPLGAAADARALPVVAADAPAYLCYTSGSTGQPKGVGQTHRNLLFFVDAYAAALGLRDRDRMSLVYTLSFNAANLDIFGALLNGATLCAYDLRRDGIRELADWLDRERVTILHAVPTVFRELAKRIPPRRILPHLRVVDLGGEAVFASDVELYRAHTREDCVFINQLASTEVALIAQQVIGHRIPAGSDAIVPVGRCPAGVRVVIRRDDGDVADVDEVGEMIVCSAHVSPGYWRRPTLDAAAFAPDPERFGWRQYRSGDFGRIDAHGNLHFLGRRGGRVKIRGHSVDLAEIEAALSACPRVMKAAVLACETESATSPERLVAYVAPREPEDRDPAPIRRHLATRLPSYMLPAGLVFVDAMPETVSGKVDRAALARMAPPQAYAKRSIEPPQDEAERAVIDIVEALLGFSPIGRDDDFFLLGGDSLLAVELQSRLGDAFGVHVANFHEDATLAGIARNIRREQAGSSSARPAWPVLFPLWRQGSAPTLFLIHGRHGQAFVSPHFMRLLGDDQPVWAFQARGLDGVQAPYASVAEMATDYLGEMRRRQPRGPYFIAALCAGTYVAAAMARALRECGETVLPLLLLDPPARLQDAGYSQMTEARFIDKMKARRAMGGTVGPVDDPAHMQSVVRVARAFEHALARHHPLAYDGPVYMLSSSQRMRTADSAGLRGVLTGPVERFELGGSHAEALDPRNPAFATCLLRCIARIREAARGAKLDGGDRASDTAAIR
jgi:amino acid adenylation domain-containing protein